MSISRHPPLLNCVRSLLLISTQIISLTLLGACLVACESVVYPPPTATTPSSSSTEKPATSALEISAHTRAPLTERWLFVGDSLTAGYGLSPEHSYVAQLERALTEGGWRSAQGAPLKLINAGVSGDTSAGVSRRIAWLLEDKPRVVFVCIGANDGLRGQPLKALRANLIKIIRAIQARGSHAILMGMKIPPNYGPDYTARFAAIYPEVARELKAPLLPFLLEGVAGRPELNLADGIHPNRDGQRQVMQTLLTFLESRALIQRASSTP